MATSATDRVRVVQPGQTHAGRQGLTYGSGASAETVGAEHIRDSLEHRAIIRAGDQIFVPADVPHAPCNESGAPCTWLVVHSSGSDQDGIVLLPELDEILGAKLGTIGSG